jgi:hypothetical protein
MTTLRGPHPSAGGHVPPLQVAPAHGMQRTALAKASHATGAANHGHGIGCARTCAASTILVLDSRACVTLPQVHARHRSRARKTPFRTHKRAPQSSSGFDNGKIPSRRPL